MLIIIFNKIVLKVSLTYPPTIMCFTFLLILVLASFSNHIFGYGDLSIYTLSVIFIGCVFFSIGGVLSLVLKRRVYSQVMFDSRLVKFILLGLLAYFPILYIEFAAYNQDLSFAFKILRLRELGLEEQVYSILTNNMIILSGVMYLLFMYLYSHKIVNLRWLLFSMALFFSYNLLTGTRATIIFLVVGSVLLYVNQTKKINKKLIFSILLAAFFLGGAVAVFMGKDGADRDKGIIYNTPYVVENYFSYGIQGVYLFDNYILKKYPIKPNWDVLSGFKLIGSKLGFDFDMHSKHADFSYFGNGKSGNVYTMFFSVYPLYGVFGLIVFFSIYGFFSSSLYYSSSPINSILLAYINGALVIGVFNEQFFTNLLYTLKLILVLFFLQLISKFKYGNRCNSSLV